jgi:hypothetical protein
VGCSNHPLVDDLTGYSTFDVMHKVRCEARDAIAAYHEEHHFAARQAELDRLTTQADVLKRKLGTFTRAVKAERAAQAAREQEWERLEVKKAELVRLVRALDDYLKDLKSQVAREGPAGDDVRRQLLDRTEGRVAAVVEESQLAARLIEQMALDRKPFMDLLGKEADAAKAFESAQDKLTSNGLAELAIFNRTTIAMQFRFEITETDNATGNASATWPVHFGTFTLGLTAGAKKTRVSDREVKSTVNFEDLNGKVDCSDSDSADESRRARVYPVTGNIGLREFVEQYFKISNSAALDTEKSFLETLKFTTTLNKGIKPSIKLAPIRPSLVTADLDLNAERKDFHTVIVGVSRPSDSKSESGAGKATAIVIGGVPEVNLRVARDPLDAYLRGGRDAYRP